MAILPNSVFQLVGSVINPASVSNPLGTFTGAGLGKHGELLTGRVHGEHFVSRINGAGFIGSTGAAGHSAIAAPAQTTGSFVLYNPIGSGIYVELESIAVTNPTSTQTQIIAGLSLEGSVQTPSGTLTLATVTSGLLGSGKLPVAQCYGSGPTIVAMAYICGLGLNITSTAGMSSPAIREFNGQMVLLPGFSINVCSTLVQTSEHLGLDLFWSEWPM
jgi:hypothetical protein